ncbi:MAG TPA: DNA polymerase III subunit beta [Candidatus Sulfotelmatobacter sp.]|nr:DNA polymerase III subunit beta [Candidatus Sulfotelmatobacter sp.]
MKVSFLSNNLSDKISFLNHAVSSRGQLPILSNLLLEAKGGKLYLSATDLEIGIQTSIAVSVEKEGKITVPAKNFSDLLLNLGSQKITLFQEGETLKLTGEKTKASFQTMSFEDFPKLYEEKGEEFVDIKKAQIENFLQRVLFSSAIDSTRPALSGILLDKDKTEIVLVATDGYRLSLQRNVFKTKEELRKPIVIPARVFKELMSIKEDEEDIKIFISEKNNQVLFTQGDTILVGRLIDSEYPEYEKIIPTSFSIKTQVSREEMLNAIKICSVFARETANIIKLSVEKNKIVVSANSPEVGEDSVEIEAKTTGEENQIAFNAKYLLDVLSYLDKDELVFEMNGPLNPGVFKIKEDNSFLHLIMPIRVQD